MQLLRLTEAGRLKTVRGPWPTSPSRTSSRSPHDDTPYRLLTKDHVSTFEAAGQDVPEGRARGAHAAHAARRCATSRTCCGPATSRSCRKILDDPEASPNDQLRRARAAEERQHRRRRRAAHVPGHRHRDRDGQEGPVRLHRRRRRGGASRAASSRPTSTSNLRYSQMAPLDMYKEMNTGTNLPAQIEIYATDGDAYKFLFMAKGGGSANKSYLFQETKALLNPESLLTFLDAEDPHARHRGLPAVPPRHRRSAAPRPSTRSRTAKLASARYLDTLPTTRQRRWATASATSSSRQKVLELTQRHGHRRAVRRQVLLPRRARHPPAAPRRVAARSPSPSRAPPTARRWARSPKSGVFLEQLETRPREVPARADGRRSSAARW